MLKSLGATGAAESKDIVITAPGHRRERRGRARGSDEPDTEHRSISIIAEKNPFPLAATVEVSNGGEPYAYVRIKMGETSNVRAVVKAGGRFYTAVKEVKVTVGGCG